jgi:hypothetical protein
LRFGPNEYNITSKYGNLFERKRGYWLSPDGTSTQDYTALVMYWEAQPFSNSYTGIESTSRLIFKSDTSKTSSTGDGIEKYGPINQPSDSTLSFSVGFSSPASAGFSASWTGSPDLTVLNNSNTPYSVNVTLDYNISSTYAKGTSVHEPAFSYRIPNTSSDVTMNNYRFQEFAYKDCGMCSVQYSSNSTDYNTSFTRP